MKKIKLFFIKLKLKLKNYIRKVRFEQQFKNDDPFIYK
jgi:hypothetical protein